MSEHELWNELGNLYFLSGAYGQAANAYQRSIQLDAGFGRPYSNLALTYVQQGKYEEAIELYRRSIELLTEDKERATSWNRLGAVYRHLKDYSKAVVAFQEADQLDPQNAEEFPTAEGPRSAPVEAPASVLAESAVSPEEMSPQEILAQETSPQEILAQETSPEEPLTQETSPEEILAQETSPEEILTQETSLEEPLTQETSPEETQTEVEWWDVDERRVASPNQSETGVTASLEDPNASWTPADPTQFQQDLSQTPETGSLTTWGEGDFEDEFEVLPPGEPIPDFDIPDPQDEELSTWIPAPEEDFSLDEIQVPPFFDELEPEPVQPAEWHDPLPYHKIDAGELVPPAVAIAEPSAIAELVEYSEPARSQEDQNSARQTWEVHEVDVEVQDRPAVDYGLVRGQLPEPLPAPLMEQPIQPETAPVIPPQPPLDLSPAPQPEPVATVEASAAERDEDEVREIEMGIAKYRRVVQVNPRNAHAWDALGTLFKSAGLYKDAILAYQQAISNDPSRSLYYHHLGLVYACEGRDEDAITAFQRVIEIDPEYSLAHATLGGYYRKMGLEELAQKHIGKAMKNIFDSENEYNRACLEAICGNADQAIALLGVALKNKQTYVDWILRDPDLDFIRQDPRFKQLISEYTR